MMKKIFSMAALALLMTACGNDIDEPQAQQQPANLDGMITITAKLAPKSEAGTRAVTPGTDSNSKDIIKVTWAADEHLAILYEVSGVKKMADATITAVDDKGVATITFAVESGTADETPCTIVYPLAAAKDDYSGVKDAATLLANQDGTLSANLDVRVGAGTISTSKPSLGVTTQPAAQFAIVKFSLTDGTNAINATQFLIRDGSDHVVASVTPSASTFYVAMLPTSVSTVRFEAITGTSFYTYAKQNATLTAGTYYQSQMALTITNMQHNPLWWVAQYNMAENKTSFVTSHSTESQYCFNWNDAYAGNVANYHLPSIAEFESIFPCYGNTDIFSLSETLASPKEFSGACNIGGSSVSANTSVIGKNADADYYAVRFIGTQYASAWHYKLVTSPCNGMLIESYLISGGCADVADAMTILAGLASSTIFTGSANASGANQTPESTTVTANAFIQRFLPACGGNSTDGSGTASNNQGSVGYYWSCSEYDEDFKWYLHIDSSRIKEWGLHTTNGISVRLFHNH